MKKLILLVIFIIGIFSIRQVNAQSLSSEHIKNFNSAITVKSDGTVAVEETIVYHFQNPRHGIFREIPLVKKNQDGESYRMSASNIMITNEAGRAYKYLDNSNSSNLSLQIGDANRTITGTHTYEIRYTLSGALTYFSDHDEIYWNITGDEWEIPILESTSTIKLPRTANSGIEGICFTGKSGSTSKDCNVAVEDNKVVVETNNRLLPGEGITAAVSFPKGHVAVIEPTKDFSSIREMVVAFVMFIVGLLYYFVVPVFLLFKAYLKLRKSPEEKRVVAAWFDPPKTAQGREVTAGEVGILYDRKGDVRDITASLIQLAQKGYIKISSHKGGLVFKKDKFTIIKTKEWVTSDLQEYEKFLLESVFNNKDSVELDELGKRTGFANKLKKTYKKISARLVLDGFYLEDPVKYSEKWYFLMFLGFFGFSPLMILAGYLMGKSAKRTPLGGTAWAVTESMKNFIKSQEKQLEFQAQNQMFFEKLLPYATALGVEKVWIERFKDIKLAQPDWLETTDFSTFVYLNMLNNFNSSVSTAVSMSTTRSSSGFSSGFSGGFSGGGGGGGGGGSW